MRELTLQEMELIAGGTTTATALSDDIVVTANPGDDGGYYPPIFDGGGGGDWGGGGGDWGGDGGGGGGGGGDSGDTETDTTTDNNGEIVVIGARFDEAARSADIVAQVKNASGYMEFVWDLATMDVQSLTLNIKDDVNSFTGSVNLNSGMATGTYGVTFSNGLTGSLTFSSNGTNYSVSAGVKLNF